MTHSEHLPEVGASIVAHAEAVGMRDELRDIRTHLPRSRSEWPRFQSREPSPRFMRDVVPVFRQIEKSGDVFAAPTDLSG